MEDYGKLWLFIDLSYELFPHLFISGIRGYLETQDGLPEDAIFDSIVPNPDSHVFRIFFHSSITGGPKSNPVRVCPKLSKITSEFLALRLESAEHTVERYGKMLIDWAYADLDNRSGLEFRREKTQVLCKETGLTVAYLDSLQEPRIPGGQHDTGGSKKP